MFDEERKLIKYFLLKYYLGRIKFYPRNKKMVSYKIDYIRFFCADFIFLCCLVF